MNQLMLSISQTYKKSFLRKVISKPLGLIGFVLIVVIILAAIFAPFIAPYDPLVIDTANKLAKPSAEHLLGTDNLGRDLFSRIIYGSRIALLVSLPAILLGILLSLILGITAGFFSGKTDSVIITFLDILASFPHLIFAMAIMTFLGPSLGLLIIVMGIVRFPRYARVMRAQTIRVKNMEYFDSAKVMGVSTIKIILKYIIPNTIGPVFIQAAMDIPSVITFEAGLSFLGLGVPPPAPSWGNILKIGYEYIRVAPEMVVYTGIALMIATLAFTFFGESLRDSIDPKLR